MTFRFSIRFHDINQQFTITQSHFHPPIFTISSSQSHSHIFILQSYTISSSQSVTFSSSNPSQSAVQSHSHIFILQSFTISSSQSHCHIFILQSLHNQQLITCTLQFHSMTFLTFNYNFARKIFAPRNKRGAVHAT